MVSPSSAAFYGGVARTLLARDIWTKPGPRIPCITQHRSRHTFGLYIVVHYSKMHMSLRTPYLIGTRNNCIFDSIAAAIRHMVLDGSRGCAGGHNILIGSMRQMPRAILTHQLPSLYCLQISPASSISGLANKYLSITPQSYPVWHLSDIFTLKIYLH